MIYMLDSLDDLPERSEGSESVVLYSEYPLTDRYATVIFRDGLTRAEVWTADMALLEGIERTLVEPILRLQREDPARYPVAAEVLDDCILWTILVDPEESGLPGYCVAVVPADEANWPAREVLAHLTPFALRELVGDVPEVHDLRGLLEHHPRARTIAVYGDDDGHSDLYLVPRAPEREVRHAVESE